MITAGHEVEIISDSPEETVKDNDPSVSTLLNPTAVSRDDNNESCSDSDNEANISLNSKWIV